MQSVTDGSFEQQKEKCPRCESTNTKFCYYNNYNLSQPRHFCKNCRRYWTKGGSLRNIPVGGGSRKNNHNNKKRSSNSAPALSMKPPKRPANATSLNMMESESLMLDLDVGCSFSTLLHSNSAGNFFDAFDSAVPGHVVSVLESDTNGDKNQNLDGQAQNEVGWQSGWPDLSICTTSPGSEFQ